MTKKIDLSEFDAITQGEWEVILLPGGGIDIGVRYTDHGHKPVVNFTQRMAEQVQQIERDVADMKAIAAVPKMIAELKRMYAREEELLDALRIIRDDLDEAMKETRSKKVWLLAMAKVKNFANDASQ